MGEQYVLGQGSETETHHFARALLTDLATLERMLESSVFDLAARIGAEQEMFLVDSNYRPAPVACEVIHKSQDPRLTTEMSRFNLEANLTPRLLSGDCFRQLEAELHEVVTRASSAAREYGADVLLTGILPTIRLSDLTLENMTPRPRYAELNRTVLAMRKGLLQVHIKGLDELFVTHDNVMLEACCTSFQIHFQVAPRQFANLYNWTQVLSAPLLAVAVNSPLLLGHRLWKETRIALFQHSVDERSEARQRREHPPRVCFGDRWVDDSVLEILREDIARFRIIFTREIEENSLEQWERGQVPALSALKLHTGTVWRWNRPCYGVLNGLPHLRIEMRALPAGPSILDEVANAAFAAGLLKAHAAQADSPRLEFRFDEVKENFYAAARHGLKAQLNWSHGKEIPVTPLIREILLPLADQGLASCGVPAAERDRLLGRIRERVDKGQTGASWMLRSLDSMPDSATREQKMLSLTAEMARHQKSGKPIHEWPPARFQTQSFQSATVADIMSTDLFTVGPNDLIDLAANLMQWRHIRHVPVEDESGRLLGIVSYRDLFRCLVGQSSNEPAQPLVVASIMTPNPETTRADTRALDALRHMLSRKIGCLPVVDDEGFLIGIVTESDFLRLAEDALSASA
ncbi:MAG: CBS domain-containing protein [Bryobacteraceae bacterium]|nr:CBS domain-containing protein [Bryobacteraceae bacterium]MDW8379907.1 CBS domain-containing protein [Bryobacterales bacterium]